MNRISQTTSGIRLSILKICLTEDDRLTFHHRQKNSRSKEKYCGKETHIQVQMKHHFWSYSIRRPKKLINIE